MNEKLTYRGLTSGYGLSNASLDYYTPYLTGLDDWTMGMVDGPNDCMIAGWVSYTVKFTTSLPGGLALRRIDAASAVS